MCIQVNIDTTSKSIIYPGGLLFFLFIVHLEALFRGTLEVEVFITVHGMHVGNTSYNLLSEVPAEKVYFIFRVLQNQWWFFGCFRIPLMMTGRPGPHALCGMASVD